MKNKEIILLMAALTKGGKTTIAIALTKRDYRRKMFSLVNNRTQVTTDWTYVPDSTEIKLTDVQLNNKGVFGVENDDFFTCERFNGILESEDGAFLKEFFKFEKQEDKLAGELKDYVDNQIKEYVENCDDEGLAKIIKDRRSSRFIRRIKVTLPPVQWFNEYLKEKEVIFVLRDTRGLLDLDPEEAKSVQTRSMNELGLDGIDAVLLLGTTAQFADITSWYKKAYKEALESVPVFIMTRPDSVPMLYDFKYGVDNENVNPSNVKDFLEDVKKATEKGFRDLPNSYKQCYRLLEMFDVGTIHDEEFEFNYKVYNNKDMRYISSYAKTLDLDSKGKEEPDYDSVEYRLFELVLFENIRDILGKTIEHIGFTEAIMKQIKDDFADKIQKFGDDINMCPDYDNYERYQVNENIMDGAILGPQNGIVTVDHGKILYLGAATSGVSSRVWLRQMISSYEYEEKLCYPDGMEIAPEIPEENKKNLIRMALFNLIEKNTDFDAHFRGYYFMNRYKVKNAILGIRKRNYEGDALTSTSKEIASLVLG
ncbi:MAG: hypothetical protein J6N21_23240 [Butyrivibrio sp.]|nr:hypothetical protein [Butyrivibrio sp.]